jgi:peroxiredoxin
MGKAARLKQERRAAAKPPPVGKRRPPLEQSRRVVVAASGGIVVVVAIVVATLLATRSSPKPAPPAPASAADRNAPKALVSAADAVDFHPTTEPGTGEAEDEPASAAQPPYNQNLLADGTTAPGFTLSTPQGKEVSLSSYRGKTVLLEFFATWCPHCNAEAPHLRKLDASLPASKYAFVSVNADGETAPSVFAFHRYYGLQYPALVDPSSQPGSFHQQGKAGTVTSKYRVVAYPTFYVIDPSGKITFATDGEQPDAFLREQLLEANKSG